MQVGRLSIIIIIIIMQVLTRRVSVG